ncbi:MAG: hypothetical protein ACRYG5_02725 [Janthinobacterium lividum]
MTDGVDSSVRARFAAARSRIGSVALVERHSRGHTLLEFSLASALGAMLTGAMLMSYTTNLAMFRLQAHAEQRVAAARAAAAVLTTSLAQTAYRGPDATPHTGVPLFGCEGHRIALRNGTDCGARSLGGDSLRIDYVADAVSAWQSRNGKPKDCSGNVVEPTLEQWNWQRSQFYIGREGAARQYLTCRNTLAQQNKGTPQAQVEGIERLEFSYLLAGSVVPVSAAAMRPGDWAAVVGIDYKVTARDTLRREAVVAGRVALRNSEGLAQTERFR